MDFRKRGNACLINKTADLLNDIDTNWVWKVLDIDAGKIQLYWEYLEYLESENPYFTITYDEEMDFFSVVDEHGEDITGELEDNTDLKRTVYSIWNYATGRY